MKYEEIIKLLDAGYSREDIMNMNNTDPDPEPEQEPTPDDPAPAPDITGEIMKEVRDMFAEMKKELIAMNIMQTNQGPDEVKTGEDVLASIINPTRSK